MIEKTYSSKINCNFLWLPRIINFLSFTDQKGKEHRINDKHIRFLLYLQELPEFYKSCRTMARELGWSLSTVVRIKKELARTWTEIGKPLIYISDFEDSNKNLRHQIEVFPFMDAINGYDSLLFHPENGQSYRQRWRDQWYLNSSKKEYVLSKLEQGCCQNGNRGVVKTVTEPESGETESSKNNRRKRPSPIVHNFVRENVKLTDKQIETLISQHGKEAYEQMINKLSAFKSQSGKLYESDYLAIRRWVVNWYKNEISCAAAKEKAIEEASVILKEIREGLEVVGARGDLKMEGHFAIDTVLRKRQSLLDPDWEKKVSSWYRGGY